VLQRSVSKGYRATKRSKNPYNAHDSIGGEGQINIVFGMGVMRV
jgi:hypothetical protein